MTKHDKVAALAELDGLVWMRDPSDHCWCWFNKITKWFCGKNLFAYDDDINWEALPDYLNSYDAIIPLIQKLKIRLDFYLDEVESPAQLCEALLRATGKWKE